MKRAPAGAAVLAVGVTLAPARAQEEMAVAPEPEAPVAAHASNAHFEIFARGGYMTPPVRGGLSPFGFGGGGGVAFTIGSVYLAASVIDYAGESDGAGGSEQALLYGTEVGYEVRPTSALTVRPFFGVGGASITDATTTSVTPTPAGIRNARGAAQIPDVITQATSSSGGGATGSGTTETVVSTFFLEPGVAATLSSTAGAFVGARVSAVYFPRVAYSSDTFASWLPWSLQLSVGQRF